MINFLFSLLFSLTALAADPPVSIKGLNQTGKFIPKWNLQVPANQVTNLGGIDALIETGNGNLLVNPSFEAATYTQAWTRANISIEVMTAQASDGVKAWQGNVSAVAGVFLYQDVTLTTDQSIGISGVPLEASIYAKTSSVGAELCASVNTVEVSCSAVQTNTNQRTTVYFSAVYAGAPTVLRLYLKNAAGSALSFNTIDDAYLGKTSGIYQSPVISGWLSWVPTTNGLGTISIANANDCQYRRVASSLEGECRFTTGTVTAAEARLGLPSGLTIASSVPSVRLADGYFVHSLSTATTNKRGTVLMNGGNTYVTFSVDDYTNGINPLSSQNGNAIFANSEAQSVFFKVPIQGWEGGTSIRADQTDFDWTACPSISGSWVSNTTYTCKWRRRGSMADFDISAATSGAPTATQLTWTLPITIDTAKLVATIANGTTIPDNGSSAIDIGVNAYPLFTYYLSTTTVAMTAMNVGSTYGFTNNVSNTIPFTFGSGDSVNAKFSVPVVGWQENGKAPQLANSLVDSAYAGVGKIHSAKVSSTGVVTGYASSWISGCTNSSGVGTCTFSTAFSAEPDCWFQSNSNSSPGNALVVFDTAATTTSSVSFISRQSTSQASVDFKIFCKGPR